MTSDLSYFFNPKSCAIIGATDSPKFGYFQTNYLIGSGKFKIYPVHIKKETILGQKAYKNIKDIPDDVELSLVLVPMRNVLQVVSECIEKGVKGIIIESAGFTETGREEETKLQNKISKIAKDTGVRIIGPNCVGVSDVYTKFSTSGSDLSNVKTGNISIIAQSGVLGNIVIDWARGNGFGFNKVITLGNKADVDEIDVIEYLMTDEKTKAIAVYLEGVKIGNETRFRNVLSKVTKKKPIIIVKNGRSEIGSKAAFSHTGSIAGSDFVYDSLFKQIGVIRANNFYQLFDFARVFASQPMPKGDRIAIITSSGSLGILTCDEISKLGLKLARFSDETIEKLEKKAYPKFNWVSSLKNPVDIGPAGPELMTYSIKNVLNDENVDALIMIIVIPEQVLDVTDDTDQSISKEMFKMYTKVIAKNGIGKTKIICTFSSPLLSSIIRSAGEAYNIPVISSMQQAVKCIKAMLEYRKYLEKEVN
ncbi:MAG: CoA-binding protein [Candidatus Helarchaeota archaeon]|nr:CoA-binding protein [Candidatus Helarchaeota archaeon]